jgi:undecaprenyl diphosphate synthase
VNVDGISANVRSLEEVGPVDLMIRTGGEQRTSNFLIWAGVNAELYFSPKLWPDYTVDDLREAVAAIQQRRMCREASLGGPTALAG